jgi:hypothetical protein
MVVICTGITLFWNTSKQAWSTTKAAPAFVVSFFVAEPKPNKPQEDPLDGCYTLVE